MAKLVTLIEATVTEGDGTEVSPYRIVTEWWTPKGERVVRYDPWVIEDIRHRLAAHRTMVTFGRHEIEPLPGVPYSLLEAVLKGEQQ